MTAFISKRVEALQAGDRIMLSRTVWARQGNGEVVEIAAPTYTVVDVALVETQRYRLTLHEEYEGEIEVTRGASVLVRVVLS